jgi:sec-independent protein translocase protein TatA
MPTIGPLELVIILVIVLIIFGARRIPEVGRSLGSGMREFKDGIVGRSEEKDEAPRAELEAAEPPAGETRQHERGLAADPASESEPESETHVRPS